MLTIYSSLAAALLLASLLRVATQQVDYPMCPTSWSWSFNSIGQNPCGIAAYLQGECNQGYFFVPPLIQGDSYTGPTGPMDASDLCKCNTVVYSLMSACGACQFDDALWFSWKMWMANCTSVDSPSTFSNTIPNMTRVPAWAFLDVTKGNGTWDPVLSYQVGDTPEVAGGQSGTLSPLPTPTTKETSVPGLSSAQAHLASKKGHGRKTPAILAGVLGSTFFVALTIVVLMLWRRRIKRLSLTRPTATTTAATTTAATTTAATAAAATTAATTTTVTGATTPNQA